MRALRDRVGKSRRGAEKIGEEQAQAIVRLQDRHELDRRRHAAEGAIERGERPVRIRGSAERGKQGRRELGQDLAGAGARHGRPPAEMPAAHRLGRHLRVLEAEPLQRRERLGVVARAGEDEVADLRRELRPFLEEQRVMRLYVVGVLAEDRLECLQVREAAEFGEALRAPRDRKAGAASARRRPSAAGARPSAGSGRRPRARPAPSQ